MNGQSLSVMIAYTMYFMCLFSFTFFGKYETRTFNTRGKSKISNTFNIQ